MVSFTSGAGKSLHLAYAVVTETFVLNGTDYTRIAIGGAVTQVILAVGTWWFVYWALPMAEESPTANSSEFNRISLNITKYVLAYSWAFALVGYLWDVLYIAIGDITDSYGLGLSLFTIAMLIGLLVASLLAWSTPTKSFYDMNGSRWREAVCLMTFWYLNFMIWWWMDQMIIYMDKPDLHPKINSANRHSPNTNAAINLSMTFALILLMGLIAYFDANALSQLHLPTTVEEVPPAKLFASYVWAVEEDIEQIEAFKLRHSEDQNRQSEDPK
jgi:hypothetical protein